MCYKAVEAEIPLVGCLRPLGDCKLQELVTLANGVVGLLAEVAHDNVLGSRTGMERRLASGILLMMVG